MHSQCQSKLEIDVTKYATGLPEACATVVWLRSSSAFHRCVCAPMESVGRRRQAAETIVLRRTQEKYAERCGS